MWQILEHKRLSRKFGKLPVEILKRYEKWKDIVQLSGPQGLREIKGFHDEALSGKRRGQRSSRLGIQYRVIYKVKGQEVIVEVIDLAAHDYRKK